MQQTVRRTGVTILGNHDFRGRIEDGPPGFHHNITTTAGKKPNLDGKDDGMDKKRRE